MDFKYPSLLKIIFALLPTVNSLYRWFYFWRNELMFTVIFARLVGWLVGWMVGCYLGRAPF